MFNVSCGKVKYRIKGTADQHTNRTWHNLEKTNGVPIQFFDPNNYRLYTPKHTLDRIKCSIYHWKMFTFIRYHRDHNIHNTNTGLVGTQTKLLTPSEKIMKHRLFPLTSYLLILSSNYFEWWSCASPPW